MSLPVLLFDLRARRTAELDRPEARQALALHRFALLDPPLTLELVAVAWWSMQFDHDAPRDQPRMIGPAVYFDPCAYTAPVLPIGGLSTSEALAAYIGAAPVNAKYTSLLPPAESEARFQFADRISLRQYRDPPGLWRRTVALPAMFRQETLTAFKMRVRALPSPARHTAKGASQLVIAMRTSPQSPKTRGAQGVLPGCPAPFLASETPHLLPHI